MGPSNRAPRGPQSWGGHFDGLSHIVSYSGPTLGSGQLINDSNMSKIPTKFPLKWLMGGNLSSTPGSLVGKARKTTNTCMTLNAPPSPVLWEVHPNQVRFPRKKEPDSNLTSGVHASSLALHGSTLISRFRPCISRLRAWSHRPSTKSTREEESPTTRPIARV